MKIINIGILAHVDAGKTTLTESLLYTSGAVPELGSVDKGTTRTDTMLLERQRGLPFKRPSLLSAGRIIRSILSIPPAIWTFWRKYIAHLLFLTEQF